MESLNAACSFLSACGCMFQQGDKFCFSYKREDRLRKLLYNCRLYRYEKKSLGVWSWRDMNLPDLCAS